MRCSLKILTVASLLAAFAVSLDPAPSFAARALQPAELLAAAYQPIYDAATKAADDKENPAARSRRAAQLAADAVAGANVRRIEQARRSPAADEAALKAATIALHAAPSDWRSSQMKAVYKNAYDAAYNALSNEKVEVLDPARQAANQQLPENLQSIAARGARIRADGDAAKVAAAFAVARAVAQKIKIEESAVNAAK